MPTHRLLRRRPSSQQRVRIGVVALVALAAITAVASAATTPTTVWVRSTTSTDASNTSVHAYGVGVRADGTAVFGGSFYGTGVDFGDGRTRNSSDSNRTNNSDGYVVGLAADGSTRWVWTTTATGEIDNTYVFGVSALADGSAIAGGEFDGDAVYFGVGTPRASSNNGSGFVEGLAADGTVRWVVTTSTTTAGANGSAAVAGVSARADGTSVAGGHFSGSAIDLGDGTTRSSPRSGGDEAAFAEGLGADGSVRWVRVPTATGTGLSKSSVLAVSAGADGTSIVCGKFRGGPFDFGDGTPRTALVSGPSFFIQSLAADGSVRWVRTSTADSGSSVQAVGVSALADGSAIVTGTFSGTAVDLGDGIQRTEPRGASFTLKLAADGSVRWVRIAASPNGMADVTATGVSALSDGTSVVTGKFSGTEVDFGDGTSRDSALGGSVQSSFTLWLAADGSVRWVRASSGGSGLGADSQAVSTLDDGTTMISGLFSDSDVDFGDGKTATSAGAGTQYSAFVQRFSAPPAAAAASVTAAATTTSASTFGPRTRCVAATCTTTGTVPAGTTRMTQVATRGSSRAAATCRIIAKGTTQTFSCRVRLNAGRWAFTTRAKAGETVLAKAVTRGTVKALKRPTPTGTPTPVTG